MRTAFKKSILLIALFIPILGTVLVASFVFHIKAEPKPKDRTEFPLPIQRYDDTWYWGGYDYRGLSFPTSLSEYIVFVDPTLGQDQGHTAACLYLSKEPVPDDLEQRFQGSTIPDYQDVLIWRRSSDVNHHFFSKNRNSEMAIPRTVMGRNVPSRLYVRVWKHR